MEEHQPAQYQCVDDEPKDEVDDVWELLDVRHPAIKAFQLS